MKIRFLSTCILSAAIVVAPITLQAEMVNTTQLLASEERSLQMELVETFIAREEVRNQMESLGVDPALAAERVAGMTDSQLQQLALNIQNMPAGSGALGVVVAVLVIVLLLEILGITNISSKV
ncbi:MAG: PA2779 family protein [Porticoccaceae bacterium]|nr:PA2779 family protein [Porticoccaceae bacterium]